MVLGNWLLFTRFKTTFPTAIFPFRGSPLLSAEIIRESQYSASALTLLLGFCGEVGLFCIPSSLIGGTGVGVGVVVGLGVGFGVGLGVGLGVGFGVGLGVGAGEGTGFGVVACEGVERGVGDAVVCGSTSSSANTSSALSSSFKISSVADSLYVIPCGETDTSRLGAGEQPEQMTEIIKVSKTKTGGAISNFFKQSLPL